MLRSIATRIGNSGAWCFMFRTEVGIPSKYRPRFWHARHSGHVCPLNQLIHFGDRVSVGGLDKLKDTARGSVLCCAVLFTQQAYPVILRFFYHSNPLSTSSIAVDKSTMVVIPSNPKMNGCGLSVLAFFVLLVASTQVFETSNPTSC